MAEEKTLTYAQKVIANYEARKAASGGTVPTLPEAFALAEKGRFDVARQEQEKAKLAVEIGRFRYLQDFARAARLAMDTPRNILHK
ncbi:MAG: hypothetical protein KGJ06_03545 [Pseudomonadota bacterium]|nr:hypothetical protein [Pseudomonadota bacterium]